MMAVDLRTPLPVRCFAVVGTDNSMVLGPFRDRSIPEWLVANNNSYFKKSHARKHGYRVAEVEIREVSA